MEAAAYILILALAIGTLFFAIAFREPPRIEKKQFNTTRHSKLLGKQANLKTAATYTGGSGYSYIYEG